MFTNPFIVWIIANLFMIITIYLIFKKRHFIQERKNYFRFVALTLILVSQYFRYFEEFFFYNFDLKLLVSYIHYPCHIGTFFAIVYLIKPTKWTRILAFFTSLGGLVSILMPLGVPFVFDHLGYTYTVDHMILSILPVYLVVIDGFRPNWKMIGYFILYSVGIVAILIPFVYEEQERNYIEIEDSYTIDLTSIASNIENPEYEFMINEKEVGKVNKGIIACSNLICTYIPDNIKKDGSIKLDIKVYNETDEINTSIEIKAVNPEDYYYINEQVLWADIAPDASVWWWPMWFGLAEFVFAMVYYLPLSYYIKKTSTK